MYEAADSGLLSPELAAGIRRVKGANSLGRAWDWVTQEQAQLLLEKADGDDLRSARDLAMISGLVGCGLRRAELSALTVEDLQIRQGHWAIVDPVGKGGHVRTVPMPAGSRRRSIIGGAPRKWPRAEYSTPSAGMDALGQENL